MGFLLKFIVILLLIAVVGGFVINQIPSWKQRVIEVVNPAAKEARLLGELKTNLDELDNALNSSARSAAEHGQKTSENKDLLARSKKLVDEIVSTNQKNSGVIKQGVGKIIDSLFDKTPYPADHLPVLSTNAPALSCPPNK